MENNIKTITVTPLLKQSLCSVITFFKCLYLSLRSSVTFTFMLQLYLLCILRNCVINPLVILQGQWPNDSCGHRFLPLHPDHTCVWDVK